MSGTAQTLIELGRTVTAFILTVILGFGLFVAFFRLHALRSVDIVFYRGLLLLAFAGVAIFVCLVIVRSLLGISLTTAFSAAVLSTSFNLAFLVIFPVTIDRSISVFMLSEMDQKSDMVFTEAQMKDIFARRYLGEWDQIDRRLHEQLLTRNIERTGNGYKISRQGQSFMQFSRFLALLFDTDRRFVGEAAPSGKRPVTTDGPSHE